MATGTNRFQVLRRCRRKVFTRQVVEEFSRIQGDWRMEVWTLEATLMMQSQTIRVFTLVRSFLKMQMAAHRLITKVTSVKKVFVTR